MQPLNPDPTRVPPSLGRFRILRPLGQGAQGSVWLAHDPRLDREVAIKTLNAAEDPSRVDAWLHEARAVSRLMHPNIVPVFEADRVDGRAYIVFEYVDGGTLADRMRRTPVFKARDAVELMLGVLDGLGVAHAAGLVHRDLKPSNIQVDAKGRARVMDFGIAAWMSDAGQHQRVVGTPGYISPEAARGQAPSPSMDVFAVAVMLAEMLSGQRLNHDPDPWRSVRRAAEQDLQVPAGLAADVDDALRSIVQRGLARDPRQRWESARSFQDALIEWLHPSVDTQGEAAADNATLEFLLRRMRHKSDFPAMSESITRIQRLTQSETESLGSLSNEILKDVALTHKLLRLVNTVQFSHAGGGSISTVSRAAALIGFAGIRNLAMSLILLERMENRAHAHMLREEFLRSLMAAMMARELGSTQQDGEEVFLAAMLQNLGRLLTEFYFPEEAQQVRRLTRPQRAQGDKPVAPVNESQASTQVLGLSYEQLALGVARQWALPESLQRAMRRPDGEAPHRRAEGDERLRWVARAANEVSELILHSDPSEALTKVRHAAQRYARVLGLEPEAFQHAAHEARQGLAQLAQAMDIHVAKGAAAQRLFAPLSEVSEDSLSRHELHATQVAPSYEPTVKLPTRTDHEASVQLLSAGIHDVTNAMVEEFKLNEVLRMILETMFRGLGFRRVILCLRDPKTNQLTGRFGLGDKVELVTSLFRVPLQNRVAEQADLFSAICAKGLDTLIADTTTTRLTERLPAWFQGECQSTCFLILPLQLKGACFGMIYADKTPGSEMDLDEKELALLRTLRNQAVMAFRQQG